MKLKPLTACSLCLGVFLTCNVSADVLLFNITRDGYEEYLNVLTGAGYLVHSFFHLDDLPDFGIEPFDGPLTEDGNSSGSIPPDILSNLIQIDSNFNAHGVGGANGRGAGGSGLLALGPSAGFGNVSNGIFANFQEDSYELILSNSDLEILPFRAAEFTVASIDGSDTIDLTIYDKDDVMIASFTGLNAPPEGNYYGIITLDKESFGRINLFDTGGGIEGIQGSAAFYQDIPAPATLLVFAIVLCKTSGRRRSSSTHQVRGAGMKS